MIAEPFDWGRERYKRPQFKISRKVWKIVLLIIIVLWLFSTFFIVGPDEVGVVLRFGKIVSEVDPGPHFKFPWPIDYVYKPKVTEMKRLEIGFKTIDPGPPARYKHILEEAQMLTGDENIVQCEFIVQYRIKDASAYLFNVKEQENTVKDAAEAAMREIIGKNKIDDILTVRKFEIQNETRELLQKILDSYNSGVLVVAVQLQDVFPPDPVISAFKDVASAREDREKAINQAEGYKNDIIPKARGEASKIVKEAEAYKETQIKKAEGDAKRFSALYKEYIKAPDITRKRLYLETLEEILPLNEIFIVDENLKTLIPLLELKNKSKE